MKRSVLILGGGLSGFTAAFEAVRRGAAVTLISDGAGASPFIHAFSTTLGEDDGTELLYEDTLRSGCFLGEDDLVKELAEGAERIPAFLREFGLDFDREGEQIRLIRPLGATVPRVASVGGQTGPTLLKKIKERLAVTPLFTEKKNTRATDLICDHNRVIGARLFDRDNQEFYDQGASAVILATGGYCRLFPQSTTPSDLGGDGIAMAYRAGAKLRDLEMIQFEPCSAVYPDALRGKSIITTLFYDGAVLKNNRGERFLLAYGPEGECLQKDVLSLRMAREINAGGAGEHGGLLMDCTAVPEEKWKGVYEAYYRRYLSVGIDLKTTSIEVAPAAHTSLGGVVIDKACRASVPGLFACGEVTGGLHGANRLGGNAGLETMVFGALAGQSAAMEAIETDPLPENRVSARQSGLSILALREELKEKLALGLGVERKEETTRSAEEWMERALLLPFDHACFEDVRLENDLLCSLFSLRAAELRKTSCGCHVRLDSADEHENYFLTVRKQNEKPLFEKKMIEVKK